MGTVSDDNDDMSTENHKQKNTTNWSQRSVSHKLLVLDLKLLVLDLKLLVLDLKQALRSADVVSLDANSLFL